MSNKEEPSNYKTSRENFDTNINTIDKAFGYSNKEKTNEINSNKQNQNTEKERDQVSNIPKMPAQSNAFTSAPLPNKKEMRESKNIYGQLLKLIVFFTIVIQYLSYVLVIEINSLTIKNAHYVILRLITFHFIFILMMACLYSTIRTNPGTIPLYWGFYIGDDDFKKKRYCLLCQVFKPDRTHHCSICNVCVLNMDHHCPWINSCIGFYNRKFFIQLLFYFLVIVLYLDLAYIPSIYKNCLLLYHLRHSRNYSLFFKAGFIFFNYAIVLGLTGLDLFFFKFHLRLVINNCTTIESLDEEFLKANKYNISLLKNWEQVFGTSRLFWFLPFLHDKAFPDGDGLNWPVNALAEVLDIKRKKRNHDNKSGSSNMSFVKKLSSNYSTNAVASSNNNYNSNMTQREKDPNLGQIIEMSQQVKEDYHS